MTLEKMKKSCEFESSIINVNILDKDDKFVCKAYNVLSDSERKKNIRELKRFVTKKYCEWDEYTALATDPVEVEKGERYKSAYWAATMLAYWGKIYDWKSTSLSLNLPDTDYFDWLNDSLRDAFCYRSWMKRRRLHPKDPNSEWIDNPNYIEDEDAADKSINYFCAARRGKEYQAANKHKRKANYQNLSIDNTFDEDGYCILDREGLSTAGSGYNGVKSLVKLFLEENKVIEAVILDTIAYGDSVKEDKQKYVNTVEEDEDVNYRYSHEFNERKVVKQLNEINEQYFTDYFNKEYQVSDYKSILDKLKSLTNGKLHNEIQKTLMSIKQKPELLQFIR